AHHPLCTESIRQHSEIGSPEYVSHWHMSISSLRKSAVYSVSFILALRADGKIEIIPGFHRVPELLHRVSSHQYIAVSYRESNVHNLILNALWDFVFFRSIRESLYHYKFTPEYRFVEVKCFFGCARKI